MRNDTQVTFRQQQAAIRWQVLKTMMARFLPAATGEQTPRCIRLDELRMNSLPKGLNQQQHTLTQPCSSQQTRRRKRYVRPVFQRCACANHETSKVAQRRKNPDRQLAVEWLLSVTSDSKPTAWIYGSLGSHREISPTHCRFLPISRYACQFSCARAGFAIVSPSTAPLQTANLKVAWNSSN